MANPDLLPGIEIILEKKDANSDDREAFLHALELVQELVRSEGQCEGTENSSHVHFPIILGCPWSSLSSLTSPALGAFGNGQISSGATSIALSDNIVHPYFFRTIPSDALQAQGIILLCQRFGWDKIAVAYVNDAYGLYLSLGIVELSLQDEYDIDTTAVSFSKGNTVSINNAVDQIATLDAYIIVLIVHDTDLMSMFSAFEAAGLTEYPYFYLGVDAWFDTNRIQASNISNFTVGSIGTVPWQTDAMPLDRYGADLQPIIDESMHIHSRMLETWSAYWNDTAEHELLLETPSSTAIYGYDAMYVLAYALQQYLDDGHVLNAVSGNIDILRDIIVQNVSFVGASGNVTFDENGDRSQGLYAFGNSDADGNVNLIGYFYPDSTTGNLSLSVDDDAIVWPPVFTAKNITPRSSILNITSIENISPRVLIPMYFFSGLSVLLVVFFAITTIRYRRKQIMRAGAWKINLVMCCGCFCACLAMFIYGIDEEWVEAGPVFSFLCNFRLWLWVLSYTLLFFPLFMKTYRLSRIFDEVLHKKVITDTKLIYVILGCVAVDLVLLIIFTSVEPLQRFYEFGGYVQFDPIDKLQRKEIQYGTCETDKGTPYIFYGLLAFWKVLQTLFGIYCALSVTRISAQEMLREFDETAQQLASIIFLVIAFCISLPVALLGPIEKPSFYYAVIGCLTITVSNSTIVLNMWPRVWASLRHKDAGKFAESPEDKVKKMILEQLKRIRKDTADNDASHHSSPDATSRHRQSQVSVQMSAQMPAQMPSVAPTSRSPPINLEAPSTPVPYAGALQ
eukprot:CAMPEP_0202709426 /NCGR_PEP_ID=MMETSP1385-20130828/21551_1 /ASSEMBLY_ACC=CAM_ASM_000861 /TAXON_ID=933848 /ORGANISM="Elphidium margaritaceum" /LENGTH=792 /DNA_ID=CAMNT_0049368687 /DNA_START=198 /DNA_END=2576 /DNA_ORIENTATION=-